MSKDTFIPDKTKVNKELADRSHMGTSWDPEKRAEQEIERFGGYVQEVYDNLKIHASTESQRAFLNDELKIFQDKFASKYNTLLAAKGRTMSTFITGGSNFNVRRADKANDAEHNKYTEMIEFRDRAQAAILRELKKMSIEERGGELEVLKKKLDDAIKTQEAMKTANAVMRKKTSKEDKIKEIIEKTGFRESTVLKMFEPDYMGRTGFPQFELTNNNANIHRMQDRVKEMERKESTPANDVTFEGGSIVDNATDDRVQIHFDAIPSAELRTKLKGEGWHWSPQNSVWQRKRTDAAFYSAERILGVKVQRERFVPPKPELSSELKAKLEALMDRVLEAGKNAIVQGETIVVPESVIKLETKVAEYQNPAYSESGLKQDGLAKIKAELAKGATVTVPESQLKAQSSFKQTQSEKDKLLLRVYNNSSNDELHKLIQSNEQKLKVLAERRIKSLEAGKHGTMGSAYLAQEREGISEAQSGIMRVLELRGDFNIPATVNLSVFPAREDSRDYKWGYNEGIKGKSAQSLEAWDSQTRQLYNAGYAEGAKLFRQKQASSIKDPLDDPIHINKQLTKWEHELKVLKAISPSPSSSKINASISAGWNDKRIETAENMVKLFKDKKAILEGKTITVPQITLTKGKGELTPLSIKQLISKSKVQYQPITPKAPLLLTAAIPAIRKGKTVEVPESAMAEIEAKHNQKGESKDVPYFRVNDLSDLSKGKTIIVSEKDMKLGKKPTAKAKEKPKCKPPVKVRAYDRVCPHKKK